MKPTYTEIIVPFHDEMIRAMFDCEKDRTSRFKKLGQVGDQFVLIHPDTLEQRWWMINAIEKHQLGKVAMHMYQKEGFVSEDDFMRFWSKIHPTRVAPTHQVYVHILKPVEDGHATPAKTEQTTLQ